jgi:RHS repeat-associated protein
MQLPGRGLSSDKYRYEFNGQEKSDEIKGEGNRYTALFWEYDPRLGRRWNVDPVFKSELSSYAGFRNNPLIWVDPNGDDGIATIKWTLS